MTEITFLGTGNYRAQDRYWNSFVIDRSILVEPAPTALPNLRKCGLRVDDLDAVFISHFHPDHTFGWPFLVLDILLHHRDRRLSIVGPPGVEAFLGDMMQLGSVYDLAEQMHAQVDAHYVEVDGTWQEASGIRFRAIEVEHVPQLRCYGFLIERDGLTVGYSGDTHPCPGLDELAEGADVLVLECNSPHPHHSHMDVEKVRAFREAHPGIPFLLTHMGAGVEAAGMTDTVLPDDFQTLTF